MVTIIAMKALEFLLMVSLSFSLSVIIITIIDKNKEKKNKEKRKLDDLKSNYTIKENQNNNNQLKKSYNKNGTIDEIINSEYEFILNEINESTDIEFLKNINRQYYCQSLMLIEDYQKGKEFLSACGLKSILERKKLVILFVLSLIIELNI